MRLPAQCAFSMFWIISGGFQICAAAEDEPIEYSHRWMVTEEKSSLVPPLKLKWSSSPIWTLFERVGAGGRNESPNRRIALGPDDSLVTVMKRVLYVIDKENGATRWSLKLSEEKMTEIIDWRVHGNTFVYTATAWHTGAQGDEIRGAVDLQQRKRLWTTTSPRHTSTEWALFINAQQVLFSAFYNDYIFSGPLNILNAQDGKALYSVPRGLEPFTDVPKTWFLRGAKLYVSVTERGKGLALKSFDMSQAGDAKLHHVYGDARLGNLYFPSAANKEGVFFAGYRPEKESALLAYNLNTHKLLWKTPVAENEKKQHIYFKQIMLNLTEKQPLAATLWPNRYVLVNPDTGALVKQAALPNGMMWTEHNAVLYSYPYIFAGVRRPVGKSTVYDLVALNVETEQTDWLYEVGRQKGHFQVASAEVLNFIVSNDIVYLSRADGRIMAFQTRQK